MQHIADCVHDEVPLNLPRAAQEMGELVSLKQQQKDSATYQAAVAARAATGAAAANLRKRCNQCEACLTSQVTCCCLQRLL